MDTTIIQAIINCFTSRSLNDLNNPASNGMGNSYFVSNGIQAEYGSKKAQQAVMYEQAKIQQSMQQLSTDYLDRGYLVDETQMGFQKRSDGYQNHAYHSSSQDPLGSNTMEAHNKYSDINGRPLRRSASSASQLIAGLGGLDVPADMYHQQIPTGLSHGHGKIAC